MLGALPETKLRVYIFKERNGTLQRMLSVKMIPMKDYDVFQSCNQTTYYKKGRKNNLSNLFQKSYKVLSRGLLGYKFKNNSLVEAQFLL